MVLIKQVETEQELNDLKRLQNANLRKLIGEEEAMKEGFVTSEYSIELLKKMHEEHPSIIAKEEDEVVGYIIVTNKAVLRVTTQIDHLCESAEPI